MYIRPTFLPEAALLPEATLPPGTRPAELIRTYERTNVRLYEPANSNRNAAYSQHKTPVYAKHQGCTAKPYAKTCVKLKRTLDP